MKVFIIHPKYLILMGCVLGMHVLTAAVPTLVTVQSQDQASMDALTAGIDSVASNGGVRHTLGAIEATMSRIVDVDDPDVVARPQMVPSLGLLGNVVYSSERNEWTLRYSTVRAELDALDGLDGGLNRYRRVLFASKQGGASPVAGDPGNACLQPGTSRGNCVAALHGYTTDPTLTAASLDAADVLTLDHGITVTVTPVPNSVVETLDVVIPHSAIYEHLGHRSSYTSPSMGEQNLLKFGIGLVFMPEDASASNVILFDVFHLIETSNQLVSFHKDNSYSIAKNIAFWTSRVAHAREIHVATVEYTLDAGHVLDALDVAVNGVDVKGQCAAMQVLIDALSTSTCLTRYQLCDPVVYSSETGQSWITIVVPVTGVEDGLEVSVDTLLRTNYTSDGVTIPTLSTLNFATRQAAQEVCADATLSSFDPIAYSQADLYRGLAVQAAVETVSGSFVVHNSSDAESISMPEALLTLVLRPKSTAAAAAYFDQFPLEELRLDDVYMSHAAVEGKIPDEVSNNVHTIEGGRSAITLDTDLVNACPLESDAPGNTFTYTAGAFECVTTRDWDQGTIIRPHSSPSGPHFVVHLDIDDPSAALDWLTTHVVGPTEQGQATAAEIIQRTIERVTIEHLQRARVYFLWPLYYWPDRSPIGLKDRTLVSLSWSLTRAPQPTRRLLAVAAEKPQVLGRTPQVYKAVPLSVQSPQFPKWTTKQTVNTRQTQQRDSHQMLHMKAQQRYGKGWESIKSFPIKDHNSLPIHGQMKPFATPSMILPVNSRKFTQTTQRLQTRQSKLSSTSEKHTTKLPTASAAATAVGAGTAPTTERKSTK